MTGRPRVPANPTLGFVGTALIHAVALAFVVGRGTHARAAPPVYQVHLLAAPEPAEEARRAPLAVSRPADEKAVPLGKKAKTPENTVAHAAPPPPADAARHEAAPRASPPVTPLPGERPSTGSDAATVSTEGVEFPYPEYLQNVVTQILARWQRPFENSVLDAEVSFFVHRDGSITDLQFVKRSGNFAFDLEAEGAVEEAGRFRAFGVLPAGWKADVLFVRFYFTGRRP
jgi:outer membrane biosynthesis protein TonB